MYRTLHSNIVSLFTFICTLFNTDFRIRIQAGQNWSAKKEKKKETPNMFEEYELPLNEFRKKFSNYKFVLIFS
jgi:hypothetical protein